MSSSILPLEQHKREMVRQVREAIVDGPPYDKITMITSNLIAKLNGMLADVTALDALPGSIATPHANSRRNHLSAISKHHSIAKPGSQAAKRQKQQAIQRKQMQFISSQWSARILKYYGWNEKTLRRDGLCYMYACAKAYPRFELDFLPQANMLRCLKHCDAVSKLDSSKEEDFAGSDGTFQKKDLKSLRDLGKGKPVCIYGWKVTLQTTSQIQSKIKGWTQNQSVVVGMDDAHIDLRDARPYHWNRFLLEFDDLGLLVRRKCPDQP
jgi:hypothetical protein